MSGRYTSDPAFPRQVYYDVATATSQNGIQLRSQLSNEKANHIPSQGEASVHTQRQGQTNREKLTVHRRLFNTITSTTGYGLASAVDGRQKRAID
jgi:hypothetical protein